jgi:hypothetical protein
MIGLELLAMGETLAAAATAIQVGTNGRPSEVLSIRADDIVGPVAHDAIFRDRWGLVIAPCDSGRRTKTRKTDGCVDLWGAARQWIRGIARIIKRRVAGTEKIFGSLDLARYEAARAAGDPSAVLDLIRADSSGPVQRLCRHYGLDPRSPGARARAPRAWAPVAVLVAAIGLWVGAFLLGALTK